MRHDFQWSWLFEPFPYDQKYQQFLRIALRAPTIAELGDWAGWVKSRFRFLILKVLADATVLLFLHTFAAQSHGSLIAGNVEQEHTNSVKFPLVGSTAGKGWD